MDIHKDEDEEASALYESWQNMEAMYNKKLATMKRTKEVIQAQLPEGGFKELESKYADRSQLILNVVSIVIFFQIMHQTKHYQTLLNNFKLLFSGRFS